MRGREVALGRGHLLLIEKGERHEISNTGRSDFKTLNFMSRRPYQGGTTRPAGRL